MAKHYSFNLKKPGTGKVSSIKLPRVSTGRKKSGAATSSTYAFNLGRLK